MKPNRMSVRYFLNRIAVILIATISFSLNVSAGTPSFVKNKLDEHLNQRAEKYLQSIHDKTADFLPESLDKADKKAQMVVLKGFAKLNNLSGLVRKQKFVSTTPEQIARSLQATDLPHVKKRFSRVFAFLAQNLQQPTEWDVIVCKAFPSYFHWERVHGVLARHYPFGKMSFGRIGRGNVHSAIIISTYFGKSFDITFFKEPVSDIFSFVESATVCFFRNNNILIGFPLIAQTIILKN